MRNAGAAVAGLACLLSLNSAWVGPAQAGRAEVIHWWTAGSEAAAVKVLADAFAKAGGEWVDVAVAGGAGANARMLALSRIAGGQPPTAFQLNYGRQLDELVTSGYAAKLDDVARKSNWQSVMPSSIYDALRRGGHLYGVPVNIHGVNWTWWSVPALAKAGVPAPTDWPSFLAALDRLKAAGLVPLALGGEPWQETILFNFVLMATGGKDLFESVYVRHDLDVIRGQVFRVATTEFLRLKAYVDEGSPGRGWNDTTAMVIAGKAGVQVMGDWAKGEFVRAGKSSPQDFDCGIGMTENGPLVVTGDLFVMVGAEGAPASPVQELLAQTLTSPDVQAAFNVAKGSIPVRLDTDMSGFDACARKSIRAMREAGRNIPDFDFTNSPDQVGAYRDAVTSLWNDPKPDIDAFVERFAEAAAR